MIEGGCIDKVKIAEVLAKELQEWENIHDDFPEVCTNLQIDGIRATIERIKMGLLYE